MATKARVTWGFMDVVLSSQLNEANTDWITRAVPILTTSGSADITTFAGGGGPKLIESPIVFDSYPFNAAKRIEDRMRVLAVVQWDESTAGNAWVIDYNVGGGWVNAPLPDVPTAPAPTTPYVVNSNPGIGAGGEDFIRNQQTIDISGLVGFQWITWRIRVVAGVPEDFVAWTIGVWLYNSVDTPL